MTSDSKFGCTDCRAVSWPARLMLTLASCIVLLHSAPAVRAEARGVLQPVSLSAATNAHVQMQGAHFEEQNYFLEFAGDHSLTTATIVENTFAEHASYTVCLHLASGEEQSFVVQAPPGGLLVEMEDMTGDHVPNDVLLRPALLSSLPAVLINEGAHYSMAIYGPDLGSASAQEISSGGSENRNTLGPLSSGFRIGGPVISHEFILPLNAMFFLIGSQKLAVDVEYSSSSGRAPPAV